MNIETGLPIPATRGGRKPRYPFRKMEVGDSILITDDIQQTRLGTRLHQIFKATGMRFTQRIQDDGIRVWRIA